MLNAVEHEKSFITSGPDLLTKYSKQMSFQSEKIAE